MELIRAKSEVNTVGLEVNTARLKKLVLLAEVSLLMLLAAKGFKAVMSLSGFDKAKIVRILVSVKCACVKCAGLISNSGAMAFYTR
ncbi:hypothetical protein Tco_1257092, partial [Tanacetum coccineum]